MESRSNDSDFATSTSILSIHELDIRLDANRGTLPRVGGSDSDSLICISYALVVKLFLGDDCFGGSRTPWLDLLDNRSGILTWGSSRIHILLCFLDFDFSIFAFAAAVAIFADNFIDRCQFPNRRLRSFFDLTLPIQETFGDNGSAIGTVDFPVGSIRLMNSHVFDARLDENNTTSPTKLSPTFSSSFSLIFLIIF